VFIFDGEFNSDLVYRVNSYAHCGRVGNAGILITSLS
jgi:hypothetical protein